MTTIVPEDLPFRRLGHYELLRRLGRGGHADVFLARDLNLHREVAIKVLHSIGVTLPHTPSANGQGSSHDLQVRFCREWQAIGALDHPNIVRALNADQENDVTYLVMDYVEGQDLRQWVEENGAASPEETCRWLVQVCGALQQAHDKGVLHRDIKPSNLLLDRKGNVRVADFGISLIQDLETARLTSPVGILGTPDFIAPEQVTSPVDVDSRADIYALGCTAYYLLVGEAPYAKVTGLTEKLSSHAFAERPALPQPPESRWKPLYDLVGTLMARDPDNRPPTMLAVEEQLRAILNDEPLPVRQTGTRLLWPIVLGAAVTAASAGVFFLWGDQGDPDADNSATAVVAISKDAGVDADVDVISQDGREESAEDNLDVGEVADRTENEVDGINESKKSDSETDESQTVETEVSETEISDSGAAETGGVATTEHARDETQLSETAESTAQESTDIASTNLPLVDPGPVDLAIDGTTPVEELPVSDDVREVIRALEEYKANSATDSSAETLTAGDVASLVELQTLDATELSAAEDSGSVVVDTTTLVDTQKLDDNESAIAPIDTVINSVASTQPIPTPPTSRTVLTIAGELDGADQLATSFSESISLFHQGVPRHKTVQLAATSPSRRRRPTIENVRDKLTDLESDQVVVFACGRLAAERDGMTLWTGNRLDAANGIRIEDLLQRLDALPGKASLFIDGVVVSGSLEQMRSSLAELSRSTSVAAMGTLHRATSATDGESVGVRTWMMMGLNGLADANHDAFLSLDELERYMSELPETLQRSDSVVLAGNTGTQGGFHLGGVTFSIAMESIANAVDALLSKNTAGQPETARVAIGQFIHRAGDSMELRDDRGAFGLVAGHRLAAELAKRSAGKYVAAGPEAVARMLAGTSIADRNSPDVWEKSQFDYRVDTQFEVRESEGDMLVTLQLDELQTRATQLRRTIRVPVNREMKTFLHCSYSRPGQNVLLGEELAQPDRLTEPAEPVEPAIPSATVYPPHPHWSNYENSLVGVRIQMAAKDTDDFRDIKTVNDDRERVVFAVSKGEEMRIELMNQTNEALAYVIYVDGVNIFNRTVGVSAEESIYRGLYFVHPAGQRKVAIDGWMTRQPGRSEFECARFETVDHCDSVAGKAGYGAGLGEVRVVVFGTREKGMAARGFGTAFGAGRTTDMTLPVARLKADPGVMLESMAFRYVQRERDDNLNLITETGQR